MRTLKAFVAVSIMVLPSILFTPIFNAEISTCFDSITLFVDDDFNESTPGWNVTNFNKIQSAIDNSSGGNTVFVYNGGYNESLKIDKSINLVGEDNEQTIIRSYSTQMDDRTIFVKSDNVSISNFNIKIQFNRPSSFYHAIYVRGYQNILIQNNNIGKIYISRSSNCTICNNYCSKDIDLYRSQNNLIENNTCNGLCLSKSNNNIIKNNILNGEGFYINDGGRNKILKNKITLNCADIKKVFKYTGLYLSSDNNIISYNHFEGCNPAIYIYFGEGNTISNNDFISNKINAMMLSVEGNEWHHNYWNRPRILPKHITDVYKLIIIWFSYCQLVSILKRDKAFFPWDQLPTPRLKMVYDMHPSLKPNCNFVGDI